MAKKPIRKPIKTTKSGKSGSSGRRSIRGGVLD
jgi:hypothetical protein